MPPLGILHAAPAAYPRGPRSRGGRQVHLSMELPGESTNVDCLAKSVAKSIYFIISGSSRKLLPRVIRRFSQYFYAFQREFIPGAVVLSERFIMRSVHRRVSGGALISITENRTALYMDSAYITRIAAELYGQWHPCHGTIAVKNSPESVGIARQVIALGFSW